MIKVLEGVQREGMERLCTALESGQFRQGKGRLCYTTEEGVENFCCLGVAMELYRPVGGMTVRERAGSLGGTLRIYGEDQESTRLSFEAMAFFGFRGLTGDVILPSGRQSTAIDLNDNLDWNFGQIAVALRYSYLGTPYPADAEGWRQL